MSGESTQVLNATEEGAKPIEDNKDQKVIIKISDVLELMENGYTRTKDHKDYNPEIGSIEEEYGLTPEEVTTMFKHEKLKGIRTKAVPVTSFVLEDDTEKGEDTQEMVNQDFKQTPEETPEDELNLIEQEN